MKKIAIILALMLVLGTVLISGCTTTQNNTSGNSSGQNKSPSGPTYIIGQLFIAESVNIGSNDEYREVYSFFEP